MLGLLPCWGVGWQWRDRRTPKGCVCCRTIGESSSVLHGPVICPPCPPEALWNAEQQESSTPEQTGPAVHPLHNNISHHHSRSWHMHMWISAHTSTQKSFLAGFYSTNPQFILYSCKWMKTTKMPRVKCVFARYCSNQQWNPLNTFSIMCIKKQLRVLFLH